MTTEQSDFILRVLTIVADHDDHSAIWWRTDEAYAPIQFFVGCNDFFAWACADLERITPANVEMLDAAYRDARLAGDDHQSWGALLFCARVRKMRPQGACYPKRSSSTEALIALFDACGPKREVGFGNPRPHPSESAKAADAVDPTVASTGKRSTRA